MGEWRMEEIFTSLQEVGFSAGVELQYAFSLGCKMLVQKL